MNIDLLSISGHKIYGPKGIGALYIRRKPKVRILPLINGGGQERGLRSGTLSPFLCVGIGKACEVAKKEMKNDEQHIRKLFNKILTRVR
jgi:cysteine desulfurase